MFKTHRRVGEFMITGGGILGRRCGILKSTVLAIGILRDPVLNDNINCLEGMRIPESLSRGTTQHHPEPPFAKILKGGGVTRIPKTLSLPINRTQSRGQTTPSMGH